jgi:magnesium-transporting ATPase (P-type)
MMVPLLSPHCEHPFLERAQKALDEFSCVGLRTLVFGCRIFSQKQIDHIIKLYQEALNSTEKKKKMNSLALKVEKELVLLGCTAILDYLQDKVPESIIRFGQAGIKVWMITGDKLQTAESIAFSAGILNSSMDVFVLESCTRDTFTKAVVNLKRAMQKSSGDKRKGIVIDISNTSILN